MSRKSELEEKDREISELRERVASLDRQVEHLLREEKQLIDNNKEHDVQLQRVGQVNLFLQEASQAKTLPDIMAPALHTIHQLFRIQMSLTFKKRNFSYRPFLCYMDGENAIDTVTKPIDFPGKLFSDFENTLWVPKDSPYVLNLS
jgi:hypothetical protein